MNQQVIISALSANAGIFKSLLSGLEDEQIHFKQTEDKWSLLEIVCHLHDEELEDFRARTKLALFSPESPLVSIDPQAWVKSRNYAAQNFNERLEAFLHEREVSVQWLQQLENPNWSSAYVHPKFGAMSSNMFLSNWLAHDYLHIRQILAVKHHYLAAYCKEDIGYAGTW
ncbi:MAG: DinB family protein [Flavobacteriales bacterium]|nr:DinB family protein [Flavobacteriales bacterium]